CPARDVLLAVNSPDGLDCLCGEPYARVGSADVGLRPVPRRGERGGASLPTPSAQPSTSHPRSVERSLAACPMREQAPERRRAVAQGASGGQKKFAEEAARLAIESVEKGWGGPFGAVIVRDGEIIGRGQNRVLLTGIPVFHAEVTAIIDASLRLNPKALLGSDYHAGTMLEMIARPPGSP